MVAVFDIREFVFYRVIYEYRWRWNRYESFYMVNIRLQTYFDIWSRILLY